MSRPILEVIALSADDAVTAERAGADRLELVGGMAGGGVTPEPDVVAAIRAAVRLPVRVMVRCNAGYSATEEELDLMLAQVGELRAAGADEFVFGLLTSAGEIDVAACQAFAAAIEGCRWTFHRALDHAGDRGQAWAEIRLLPGVDTVLTGGSSSGVGAGLRRLLAEAATGPARPALMAGGGLREEHVPYLLGAGVTRLHVGSSVRVDESWDGPMDARAVARWRELAESPTPAIP
jgi:copper homeostasis protein